MGRRVTYHTGSGAARAGPLQEVGLLGIRLLPCVRLPTTASRARSGPVAVFVVVFNLIVDLLYAVLDPRVRYD